MLIDLSKRVHLLLDIKDTQKALKTAEKRVAYNGMA